MKERTMTADGTFESGELYLFHPTDPSCLASESLWGLFDKAAEGRLFLESSSSDLLCFDLWHPLPAEYRYGRLATRAELRDYAFSLACAQDTAWVREA